jgi:hypothetical protein
MAHPALVNMDVLQGERIVRLLDDAQLKLSLALWLLVEEYADWRFALASKDLDRLSPFEQIKRVKDILRESLDVEHIPTLWIMNTQEPFPRNLHKLFGKAKRVEGMRLGGQFIGNRFIEDAYVYRIR